MVRALVLFVLAACTTHGGGPTREEADDQEPTCAGGALPAPSCGEGSCACCASCDLSAGLCMAPDWHFDLGVGSCVAPPTDGTLEVMIDGALFTATEVAAVVDNAYVAISARNGEQVIAMRIAAPNGPGTYDCAADVLTSFLYVDANTTEHTQPRTGTRPPCTVAISSIGDVGGRIEGTFAVTLSPALELTAGTFSVGRVPYP